MAKIKSLIRIGAFSSPLTMVVGSTVVSSASRIASIVLGTNFGGALSPRASASFLRSSWRFRFSYKRMACSLKHDGSVVYDKHEQDWIFASAPPIFLMWRELKNISVLFNPIPLSKKFLFM